MAASRVVDGQRLLGAAEADVHVEPARDAAPSDPRVVARDLAVARAVCDLDRARGGRVGSRCQKPHASADRVDESRAGVLDLTAEPGNGETDRRHDLDLRGSELGVEADLGKCAQDPLDLVDGLERLGVDDDQLLLEPDRRRRAPPEAGLVHRGQSVNAAEGGDCAGAPPTTAANPSPRAIAEFCSHSAPRWCNDRVTIG